MSPESSIPITTRYTRLNDQVGQSNDNALRSQGWWQSVLASTYLLHEWEFHESKYMLTLSRSLHLC